MTSLSSLSFLDPAVFIQLIKQSWSQSNIHYQPISLFAIILQLKFSTEIYLTFYLSFFAPKWFTLAKWSKFSRSSPNLGKNSSLFTLVCSTSSGSDFSMIFRTSANPEWLLQSGRTPAAIDSIVTMPKASGALLGTTQTVHKGSSFDSN